MPGTLLSLQRGSKKSLADVAQHRQALTTQAVVVFNVPPCLNLTIKPLVSLLGGSQAKVLKTVQSRTVASSEHQPDLHWGSRRDEHAHLQGKGALYPPPRATQLVLTLHLAPLLFLVLAESKELR